jgi:hypothetical protein
MTCVARKRELRTAKQRAYRARLKDGLKSYKLDADPQDMAELLTVAHIAVPPNADVQAINRGLTDLARLFSEGRLRVLVVNSEDSPVVR